MASFTAALAVDPWVRQTPRGYEVIGNTPIAGPEGKEAGTGSKQAPLGPKITIAIAKFYPDFAKKRLRDEGYIVDDATNPDNTSPEGVDPTVVGSNLIAVSRNYPPHIVAAFEAVERQGRHIKLSVPG
jgi:hypothetical protein